QGWGRARIYSCRSLNPLLTARLKPNHNGIRCEPIGGAALFRRVGCDDVSNSWVGFLVFHNAQSRIDSKYGKLKPATVSDIPDNMAARQRKRLRKSATTAKCGRSDTTNTESKDADDYAHHVDYI